VRRRRSGRDHIEPPPILEILPHRRANDVAALKDRNEGRAEAGVSPEVFGAWFTGQGKMDGITAELNVSRDAPVEGLSELYKLRQDLMLPLLIEARKAKPETQAPRDTGRQA